MGEFTHCEMGDMDEGLGEIPRMRSDSTFQKPAANSRKNQASNSYVNTPIRHQRKVRPSTRFFLTRLSVVCILDFRAETPYTSSRKNPMTSSLPITLPAPSTAERYSRLSVDDLRQQALLRLYERRSALQTLIGALEEYERSRDSRRAQCIDISAFAPKYSSSSAQSRI
jgi:hypothetical protein